MKEYTHVPLCVDKQIFGCCYLSVARLAQSVEHETLNLRVVGSSPTLGASFAYCHPAADALLLLILILFYSA